MINSISSGSNQNKPNSLNTLGKSANKPVDIQTNTPSHPEPLASSDNISAESNKPSIYGKIDQTNGTVSIFYNGQPIATHSLESVV